jgi:hypothetical protein
MSDKTKFRANDDNPARAALWKAICLGTEHVQARFNIKSILTNNGASPSLSSAVPDVFTWQLVEALSLLCILRESDDASVDKLRLFGKTGPVTISKDGNTSYLWAQRNVGDATSGLNGRPDLVVTSSNAQPGKHNVMRVIEVKCVNQLGAQVIRSEFGKAYDLRVTNFLIWSYYTPRPNVIEGAKQLGIDIASIGFDTKEREDLIRDPHALIAKIANTQESVRRAERFGKLIADVGDEVEKKLFR